MNTRGNRTNTMNVTYVFSILGTCQNIILTIIQGATHKLTGTATNIYKSAGTNINNKVTIPHPMS